MPLLKSTAPEDVASGILEIVMVEGPVRGRRILRKYQEACGLRYLDAEDREVLSAVDMLVSQELLVKSEEMGRSSFEDAFYRHVLHAECFRTNNRKPPIR